MTPLVEIRNLTVEYRGRKAGRRTTVRVIDGLDLDVFEGETLGVVGESGSGKSTLASALIRLVDPVAGSVRLDGVELLALRRKQLREARAQIQLVFQNPLLSLSPRRRIGKQLEEPLLVHTGMGRNERDERIDEILEGLDLTSAVKSRFPHEMSGGQAQRVVLARALTLRPRLILFDEPTSALDVSVQAGVLNLLQRLREEHDLTYVFITHDLAVARHLADRIAVMKSGEILELKATEELFSKPEHHYTQELIESSLGV